MRSLVTGGAGFIGSHLCDALIDRGWDVVCIDNLRLGRRENVAHLEGNRRFRFECLDVLNEEGLERAFQEGSFDGVFHLAANSDIREGSTDRALDLQLNFETTRAVLEAMLRHHCRDIFFASTSAVFGELAGSLTEESGPTRPISFYGASKLAAEAYLSVYSNNYGFRTRVLRFPNVVGPRMTHGAIFDFVGRLAADPTHLDVLGNGTQSKPYLSVEDLVRAILLVWDEAKGPFAVYHVGNDDQASVAEIASIVLEEMGLAGIPIRFSGGDRGWVGDVPTFSYDISKIRELGFERTTGSLEALRRAARSLAGENQRKVGRA